MGRTALYRDPVPFCPARAEVQLDADALLLALPDGRARRHGLDGFSAALADGLYAARVARISRGDPYGDVRHEVRSERRFVRMLVLERDREQLVIITPPELGAVAPNVVRLPPAPADAAIIDDHAWDALADWLLGGGRLSGCSIAELARLAVIATSPFAALIGEVAAQRALELARSARGPLRGVVEIDIEAALQPLVAGARHSSRVGEALVAALSHTAGALRPRRRA